MKSPFRKEREGYAKETVGVLATRQGHVIAIRPRRHIQIKRNLFLKLTNPQNFYIQKRKHFIWEMVDSTKDIKNEVY